MSRKYDEDFIEYLPQIRNAAYRVADKFGEVFVVDELVNEAWIRGINSNRSNKSQFVSRAIWDMKDYVRSSVGRKGYTSKGKWIKPQLRFSLITNYDDSSDDWRHISGRSIFDGEYNDKNFLNLENNELIKIILNRTTIRSAEAMINYYLNDHSLVETGKLMCMNDSAVSVRLRDGRADCLEAVKRMGLENVAI